MLNTIQNKIQSELPDDKKKTAESILGAPKLLSDYSLQSIKFKIDSFGINNTVKYQYITCVSYMHRTLNAQCVFRVLELNRSFIYVCIDPLLKYVSVHSNLNISLQT